MKRSRLLKGAAAIVGLYVVVYLIGANLFLNVDGLRSLISPRPEQTLVDWDRGWTLLPGFIRVEGLRIRGQSRGMQWQVRVGDASIRMSVLALTRKTVRITHARGNAFEYRMRTRLAPGEEPGFPVEFAPEIEGFSNPPSPAPEEIYPPRNEEKRRWRIDISGVDLRGPVEMWLGGLRTTGTGRVGGAVDFQLGGEMTVPAGVFDLVDARVQALGDTLADKVKLDMEFRIEPFRLKVDKGLAIMEKVFGSYTLKDGHFPDLRALNAFIPKSAGIEALSGQGLLNVSLTKTRQEQGGYGFFTLDVDGARLRLNEEEISSDLDVDMRLNGGALSLGWYEISDTTISFENTVLPSRGTDDDETWWGRLLVKNGRFVFAKPVDVDVIAEFEMHDTAPLLHAFLARSQESDADKKKAPKWLKLVPNIKNVSGQASVDLDQEGLIVDDVVVNGDKFDLMARLANRGRGVEGQAYVRYRFFHLGIGIQDGKRNLKWIKPRRWFLEQPEFDDSTRIAPPSPTESATDGA